MVSDCCNFKRKHLRLTTPQVKWEALEEHDTTWKTNGLADLCYAVIKREILDGTNEKATKITVDVQLNGTHWSNEKCGIDYMAT